MKWSRDVALEGQRDSIRNFHVHNFYAVVIKVHGDATIELEMSVVCVKFVSFTNSRRIRVNWSGVTHPGDRVCVTISG